MAAKHVYQRPPAGAAADWTMPQNWEHFTPAEHAAKANQAGHHPDLLAEPLRHQLEHRAVADPQRAHHGDEQPDR